MQRCAIPRVPDALSRRDQLLVIFPSFFCPSRTVPSSLGMQPPQQSLADVDVHTYGCKYVPKNVHSLLPQYSSMYCCGRPVGLSQTNTTVQCIPPYCVPRIPQPDPGPPPPDNLQCRTTEEAFTRPPSPGPRPVLFASHVIIQTQSRFWCFRGGAKRGD